MTTGKQKASVESLQNQLGWSEVEVKFAGDFKKFSDTKTTYKAYFTKDGERFKVGFNANGFVAEDAFMFYLKSKIAKLNGAKFCSSCGGSGKKTVSAMGRTIENNCNKCGGYGVE